LEDAFNALDEEHEADETQRSRYTERKLFEWNWNTLPFF
jgi:hypothetical protein